MDLNDLANEATTTVVRFKDADATLYRLDDDELTEAEDIGDPDGFPEFGYFAPCTALTADGDELGPRYVEVPAAFAEALGNANVEPGDSFRVAESRKTEDGAWAVTVERLDL